MKRYRTTKTVDFFCGRIGLSGDQAASRARNLRPVADGLFEITGPLQFKAGEVISLDETEKMVLGRLECLDKDPAPAKPDPVKTATASFSAVVAQKPQAKKRQRKK